jgi:hypothetical protein
MAFFKHMAYFAKIQTSTCITTSIDLVGRQSFLGFVPRVLVLVVIAMFSFDVLVEGNGLRRSFKVCFIVLRMSPRLHSI